MNTTELKRKAIIAVMLFFGIVGTSMATTFTATTSGNWSSSTTWGGSGPGFNISGADALVIPIGVTVTLDSNLTVNNASASLSVIGSLTGSQDITLTAGTLSGSGSISANALTVGAGGYVTTLGTISVSQFTNSQAALAVSAILNVSNSIILNAGVLQLNAGSAVHLAANSTINMAGGTYSSIGGGLMSPSGSYNLVYSGTVSTIGVEATLTGLQNVTVNLASATNQLSLSGNLVVTGLLSLQQGVLKLSGNTLTLNGGINTSASGSIAGSATSNIFVNGTGSVGTMAFAAGSQTLQNLTVAIASTGSVSLASDVTVGGVLTLTGSNLNLGSR